MNRNRQLFLIFSATLCLAAGMGLHDSIFNNFLSDTFDLSADARGFLELPRELPGFLVVVSAGLLAALPITGMGMVSALVLTGGLLGMAFLGGTYWMMIVMMMTASAGMHLMQPVTASIALALSDPGSEGKRLGQMGAMETIGVICGTGFVWLVFDKAAPQYRMGFLCAAGLAFVVAILCNRMHISHLHEPRQRIVFNRRFGLYYFLEFLHGARKQIFLTFGPWVLIKVYHQPATGMAALLMTAAIIGIVFKPLAGLAIDRFGERIVLVADNLVLMLVCVGYGYALVIMPNPEHARVLACGCFIADNLLFALGSARVVYLSRMTTSPQEITSTLAMGVTINHSVSMTIPLVAGAIWMHFGYERVFLSAAALAAFTMIFCTRVPAKRASLPVPPVVVP